eukprot:992723-Amphidinium_carterae.2
MSNQASCGDPEPKIIQRSLSSHDSGGNSSVRNGSITSALRLLHFMSFVESWTTVRGITLLTTAYRIGMALCYYPGQACSLFLCWICGKEDSNFPGSYLDSH